MGRRLRKPKYEIGEIAICNTWGWYKAYCKIVEIDKVYKRVNNKGHFYHQTDWIKTEKYLKNNHRWRYEGQYILVFTDDEIIRLKHHNYCYRVKVNVLGKSYVSYRTFLQDKLIKKVIYEAELVTERLMK